VFKSADGGIKWELSKAGPAIVDVPALSVDPRQPNTIYAAAGLEGVLRSADRGATWTKLAAFESGPIPSEVKPAPALSLVLGSDSSTIYTWATCIVMKSVDRGVNWTSDASPPPYCLGTGAFISIDPHDPRTAYLAEYDSAEGDGWLLKTT